ncbi:hypothetical protein [Mumia sp. ZJ430]|uniref:hypothetical protein n=1 Tax=Mumia sp. ZJ430 TaxID=2708083 RepID=UPI00141D9963|nr:hypothetical protein [Mumia sp. ZJ430]
MTSRRPRWFAAVALAAALTLSACGSDDESGLSAEATASETASASEAADGFTAEEREVIEAVERYQTAFYGRGAKSIEATLEGTVTDQFFAEAVAGEKATTEDKGLQRLGPYSFEPSVVTIEGDEAEVRGCLDTTSSFVVKRGETEAGVGSQAGQRAKQEITLERVDGTWLVAFPFGKDATC